MKTKVANWSLLDYKLAFTHCSGEVLDYEITTTCVVSGGECLRGHPDESSVRNSGKVGFRSASSFFHNLRT